MNYIEQFMKDNDIKIDEEFYVVNENGDRIKKLEQSRFYFGTSLFLFKKQYALPYDDAQPIDNCFKAPPYPPIGCPLKCDNTNIEL